MGSVTRLSASLLVSSLVLAPTARAQPGAPDPASDAAPDPEARAIALREAARRDAEAGRIEEAFIASREAAELTRDPVAFRELGELADRLRLDTIALAAYEAYLARRADAPDRAAIEGRVRVLRLLRDGHRFSARPLGGDALVDWDGRPVLVRRRADLVPLAEWDGTLPAGAARASVEPGLGRRLSPP